MPTIYRLTYSRLATCYSLPAGLIPGRRGKVYVTTYDLRRMTCGIRRNRNFIVITAERSNTTTDVDSANSQQTGHPEMGILPKQFVAPKI